MKIGYLTFGRDDFGYGLALCLSKLDKKHEIYRVSPKTAKYVDVLLFSCFWWEHIYLLADFLRKANINLHDHDRPRIIIGGFNTFNPVPFKRYCDVVVCGDGENIINDVINGYDPGFKWHNNKKLTGFAHVTNNITRMEVARGCKYHCKFCAVSHLKPFREIDIDEIKPLIKISTTKRIAAFSPEPTLHSKNDEITELCHRYGKSRLDTDVRLDRIMKRHSDGGLLRCGIEGLSERLRKTVNKGYSDDFIYESIKTLIKKKTNKGILFYLIMDLPTETNNDFKGFTELLRKIETIDGCEDFLIVPSPSVFIPNPHTPMEFDEIHWERDYAKKWKYLFRPKGYGDRPWKFMMAERARIFSPEMRVLSMLSIRAGDEFFDVENKLNKLKIIQISNNRLKCNSKNKLIDALNDYGGVEKYCGRYTKATAPWKVIKFD